MSWGFCILLSVPGTQSLRPGVCGYRGLCATPLLAPLAHPLRHEVCVCCRALYVHFSQPPGPPSALGPVCALQRFVFRASPGPLGPPPVLWVFCGLLLVPQACHLAGAIVRELFMGWKSATFSLFPALMCPAFWDSTAPPWACLWRSLPVHGNSPSFMTPSPPQGTRFPPVLLLFPFSVSALSPTAFQGA